MTNQAHTIVFAVFGSLLILSGCAGVGIIHKHTVTEKTNLALGKERGSVKTQRNSSSVTKETTLRAWGPPDRKRVEGEVEVWVYRRELAFSGPFLVLVFIPVPLIAPVGYRHTELYFSGEILTKVDREFGAPSGAICGLAWDWSAGSGWSFSCGDI